jgi:hypothetical protein
LADCLGSSGTLDIGKIIFKVNQKNEVDQTIAEKSIEKIQIFVFTFLFCFG